MVLFTSNVNGENVRQEDDVVQDAVTYLRARGWMVLASGAIQGSFRVVLPDGKTKAPDLVAWRAGVLLVGEAKLSSGRLFANRYGLSDFEVVRLLKDDPATAAQVMQRAERLLVSRGYPEGSVQVVEGLLIGGSRFADERLQECSDLVCLEAMAGTVRSVARPV
jgi:hypothetical protein